MVKMRRLGILPDVQRKLGRHFAQINYLRDTGVGHFAGKNRAKLGVAGCHMLAVMGDAIK
mgnify:CR=1 FL=1